MARFFGDNGKPDDTSLKDLLSPYEQHRSALTDCGKLSRSELLGQKAILIYGFEYEYMPLEPAIDAFETLARRCAQLGQRHTSVLENLTCSRSRSRLWLGTALSQVV